MYVAPIGDEIIFGCDIIDDKNITINTRRGLEVQGEWVNCDVIRKADQVARVLLKETVTIPPNSEVILPGRSVNLEVLDTRFCSVEPVFEDERNVLIARCLVDPYENIVPVRVVNLENSPIKMKKNYLIGELHPVLSFENFSNDLVSEPLMNMSATPSVFPEKTEISDCPLLPDDWTCFKIIC